MENKKTDMEQYLKVPEWAAPYDEKMTMLLTGKIKIQELPLNERASLYIFAIRYARDVCQDKDMAYMEKRLIEQQLLNDIIEVRAAGDKAREKTCFEYSGTIFFHTLQMRMKGSISAIYGKVIENEKKDISGDA